MNNDIFKFYWFNQRTGYGHPAIMFPQEVCFDEAFRVVRGQKKWAKPGFELRYEPKQVFEELTSKNEPV